MTLAEMPDSRNRFIRKAAIAAVLTAVLAFCGCGGGGGGGGGGAVADTTAPAILFTNPNPSGSLSFEADPTKLPSQLAASYSDASGINSSSFASTFVFRGISFSLGGKFTAGASSASTNADVSPLYWTIISKFRASDNALVSHFGVFGVTKSSTGVNNPIDIDTTRGLLVMAATSRNRLLIVNTSTGATEREVSGLPGTPSTVRVCPAYGKIYAAFSGSASIYSYSITTGAQEAVITMPAAPRAMVINKAASKASVIFDNSKTLVTISCNGNTTSTDTLGANIWNIDSDGQAGNTVYYAGYIGADKALYSYASGVETRLAGLSELPEDMAYDAASSRLLLASYASNAVDVRLASDGSLAGTVPTGTKPTVARAGAGGRAIILNSASDNATIVNTAAASSAGTVSLTADPVGVVSDADASGYYYVLQNLWEISISTSGTLSASVRDSAGNTGSTNLSLSFTPVSSGGPSAP